MEIGLENFYMDLGALRVSELNEGGDIFCSLLEIFFTTFK